MGHATALPAVASFAADVGAKIGLAERTIRENIARARKIEPKLRDRVRALPAVADSGPELDALARLKPDEQKAALAMVETGRAPGIRAARKLLRPSPAVAQDAAREKRRAEFPAQTWLGTSGARCPGANPNSNPAGEPCRRCHWLRRPSPRRSGRRPINEGGGLLRCSALSGAPALRPAVAHRHRRRTAALRQAPA